MKKLLQIVVMSIFALASFNISAYSGVWSSPDYFGNSYYYGSDGTTGSLSSPDYFGNSYFNFSDGISGSISSPDYFGNTYIYWD